MLRRAESGADRYGRVVAYAYTLRDDDEFLLQRELLAEGLARVGGRIGHPCAGDLLDHEKAAREAKLGLWADPYYEMLDADSAKDALAHRGRFALVEGKVASVRESGPTIYVNFGRRRIGCRKNGDLGGRQSELCFLSLHRQTEPQEGLRRERRSRRLGPGAPGAR